MIEKATSAASIASMLRTLEAHSSQAKGLSEDSASGVQKTNFAEIISKAVSQTNAAQVESQNTTRAFESGEAVPLTEVVMKMQKASLSFEATLQVRNKVLKAYEDVMNMPV